MKRSYPFNNSGPSGSPSAGKKPGAGGAAGSALGAGAGSPGGMGAGPAPNAYANYGYAGNAGLTHDQQQAQWHQQWQQYYAQQAATASAPAAPQPQASHYGQQHVYQQPVQPPAPVYQQAPAQPYQHQHQQPQQAYYAQPAPQYNAPPQPAPTHYAPHGYSGGPPPPPIAAPHVGPAAPISMGQSGMRLGSTTTHGSVPPMGPTQQHGGAGYNHARQQLPAPPGAYTPMGSGSGFAAPMAGPQPGGQHQNHQQSGQRNAKRPRFDGPTGGAPNGGGGAGAGVFPPPHSSLPAPPTGPSGVVRPQMGQGMRNAGNKGGQYSSPGSARGGNSMGPGTPSGPRGGAGNFASPSPRGPAGPSGRDFGSGRVPSGPRGQSAAGPGHYRTASVAGSDDSRYGREGRDRDRFGGGGGRASDRDRDYGGGRDRAGGRGGPGFQQRPPSGPSAGSGISAGGRGPIAGSSYGPSSSMHGGRGARQRSPLQQRNAGKDFRGSGKAGAAGGSSGRDGGGGGRNPQGSQSSAFANRSVGGPPSGPSALVGAASLPAKVLASASGSSYPIPTGPKTKADANRKGTTDMRAVGLVVSGVISWEWTLDDGAVLLGENGVKEDHSDDEESEHEQDGDDRDRSGHDGHDEDAVADDGGAEEAAVEQSVASVAQAKQGVADAGGEASAAEVGLSSQVNGDSAAPDAEKDAAGVEQVDQGPAAAEVEGTKGANEGKIKVDGERAVSGLSSNEGTKPELSQEAHSAIVDKASASSKGKQVARRPATTSQPDSCRLRICFGIPTPPSSPEVAPAKAKAEALSTLKAEGPCQGKEARAGDVDMVQEESKADSAMEVTAPSTEDAAAATEHNDTKGDEAAAAAARANGASAQSRSADDAESDMKNDELRPETDEHDSDTWTPFSKTAPQPAANRVTLVYGNGQQRIHIDADVIQSMRVYRDERRVEIDVDTSSAALAGSLEGQKEQEGASGSKMQDWMVCKGILLDARSDDQHNYAVVSVDKLRSAHEPPSAAFEMDLTKAEAGGEDDSKVVEPESSGAARSSAPPAKDADNLALSAFPPLFRLRTTDDDLVSSTTFVVQLDPKYPVRQTEWLRTGDVEEFLSSFEAPLSHAAERVFVPNPWRSKIFVMDPDPEPTIDDILQIWGAKSYAGNGRERRRFLREFFELSAEDGPAKEEDGREGEMSASSAGAPVANSPWALGQILGRLGVGKNERYIAPTTTAAKIRSGSSMGPNPLTIAASGEMFGSGHAQSVAGLASVALFDFIQELAPAAGWTDSEVRARIGQLLMGLPQHTLFRALDSLFKDFTDALREREREAARVKAREQKEQERSKATETKSRATAAASGTEDQSAAAASTAEVDAEAVIVDVNAKAEADEAAAAEAVLPPVAEVPTMQVEQDAEAGHHIEGPSTAAEDASFDEQRIEEEIEISQAQVALLLDDVAMQIAAEAAL
ncbi:hypothetical protein OC842_005715 [Tilletia horrida]|uniref:Uncharacterized protein n=1 Tax=Tilletia horrida TaxID=155126 RepID=A0AAN6JP33_9BASI|nr:hypothetical protein OC842_005715 [Tilletia horrida]